MRRHREEMQVNVAGLRRNIKNLAHNYSDAQVKVREATSNDPWGPSSTLMSEIADLTYNVVAFSEIMQMVWKRLNDHGKNWRHVYKALVLLEYLIKTGSEKVGQQCKENIYAIQTLKDFQYYEEIKDQGINVREKAKHLVALLKDEERLKNERTKALKAKERFAQTASGFGSEGAVETITLSTPSSPVARSYQGSWTGGQERPLNSEAANRELESARPQTLGEEELQLQLALAMSREEAEQDEQRRKSDDVRLQLALSQSQHEFRTNSPPHQPQNSSNFMDLLDINMGSSASADSGLDPWGVPQAPPPRPQADPWSSSVSNPSPSVVDPWAPISGAPPPKPAPPADPWRPVSPPSRPPPPADPWSPNTDHSSPQVSSPSDLDDFDIITNRDRAAQNGGHFLNNNGASSPDPFDLGGLGDSVSDAKPAKKSPHSFLGENSSLVNLDNLVTTSVRPTPALQPVAGAAAAMANPFAGLPPHPIQPTATIPPQNLFQQQIPPRPSMNQIRQQPAFVDDTLPSPLTPAANPFLL